MRGADTSRTDFGRAQSQQVVEIRSRGAENLVRNHARGLAQFMAGVRQADMNLALVFGAARALDVALRFEALRCRGSEGMVGCRKQSSRSRGKKTSAQPSARPQISAANERPPDRA